MNLQLDTIRLPREQLLVAIQQQLDEFSTPFEGTLLYYDEQQSMKVGDFAHSLEMVLKRVKRRVIFRALEVIIIIGGLWMILLIWLLCGIYFTGSWIDFLFVFNFFSGIGLIVDSFVKLCSLISRCSKLQLLLEMWKASTETEPV